MNWAFVFLLVATSAFCQPIMPMMTTAEAGDTNEYPVTARATLQWDKGTNALSYRWTNWNAATNQGGWTTATNVPVVLTLGTNWAGVRLENGPFVSPWAFITNRAVATNMVGILGIQTRTMAYSGATWGPWLTTTQMWYDTSQFQKQWRPMIVNSNWWRLDKL